MKRFALLVLVSACTTEVPDAPAWGADVKPILTANCLRCHGAPALGGAPPGFRLDVYTGKDGALERIQGAGEMLEFLRLRVEDGHGELLDHQIETLARWDGFVGDPRPDNQAPVFTVLEPAEPTPVRDAILIDYELRDPDFETIHGELRVGSIVVDDSLHAGRGRAGFSTATFPEDEVRVLASYSDGQEIWQTDLGLFPTGHDGDISSRVLIHAPGRHSILSDRDATTIIFEVVDVDSPGPFTADIRAVRDPLDPDEEPVVIATGLNVPAAGAAVAWDTTGLAESETWRLTISVADAAGSGGGASVDRLIVTHQTSNESFASLDDVFDRCTACHDGTRVAGLDLRTASAARAGRAAIYQRVIKQRNMPPRSASLEGIAPVSETERERLAGWLLAGAL